MVKTEEERIRVLALQVECRRFKPRSPRKIADAVNTLLARRGYAQVQVQERLLTAWQSAVGDAFDRVCRVGQLRRGVLEVVVRDSSVLQELTFQKRQLVDKLAACLENMAVKELRFRVGAID